MVLRCLCLIQSAVRINGSNRKIPTFYCGGGGMNLVSFMKTADEQSAWGGKGRKNKMKMENGE